MIMRNSAHTYVRLFPRDSNFLRRWHQGHAPRGPVPGAPIGGLLTGWRDLRSCCLEPGWREESCARNRGRGPGRSEEHTSELQSPCKLVCRLLLEKKKNK